ncbi:unnamed protein product, partial [Meganyctiphanes norvegica]
MEGSLVVLLALVCTIRVSADVATQPALVDTLQGSVSGIFEKSTEGRTFESYYGIPYAKPPVGDLRFMAPIPSDTWGGILDGSKLKAACPQMSLEVIMGQMPTVGQVQGDEDCLHLNIFTHKTGKDMANLPVMVWIHGGAYQFGSVGWSPPYVMMNKDIVLVTLQYRLGSLGFLSTEDSLVPGNMGLKDQTLALSWVRQNIHNFGGDPAQVTIFGESAGSASVHMQILTPHSNGLFQRAIMQSGNALCPWAMGDDHLSHAKRLATDLGCPNVEDLQFMIEFLQAIPLNDLIIRTAEHMVHLAFIPNVFGPRVDGDYLPEAPEILLRKGHFKGVDLIAGINSHEGAIFAGEYFGKPDGLSTINDNFAIQAPLSLELREQEDKPVGIARTAFDFYLGFNEKVEQDSADKVVQKYGTVFFLLIRDYLVEGPVRACAHALITHRQVFTEIGSVGSSRQQQWVEADIGSYEWVSHSDDLFYFFEGGDDPMFQMFEQIPMTDADLKIRDQLTTMWYTFAKTGNPTPDKNLGFVWSPTNHNLEYLSVGSPVAMRQDQSREKIHNFWTTLPSRQNNLLNP